MYFVSCLKPDVSESQKWHTPTYSSGVLAQVHKNVWTRKFIAALFSKSKRLERTQMATNRKLVKGWFILNNILYNGEKD